MKNRQERHTNWEGVQQKHLKVLLHVKSSTNFRLLNIKCLRYQEVFDQHITGCGYRA